MRRVNLPPGVRPNRVRHSDESWTDLGNGEFELLIRPPAEFTSKAAGRKFDVLYLSLREMTAICKEDYQSVGIPLVEVATSGSKKLLIAMRPTIGEEIVLGKMLRQRFGASPLPDERYFRKLYAEILTVAVQLCNEKRAEVSHCTAELTQQFQSKGIVIHQGKSSVLFCLDSKFTETPPGLAPSYTNWRNANGVFIDFCRQYSQTFDRTLRCQTDRLMQASPHDVAPFSPIAIPSNAQLKVETARYLHYIFFFSEPGAAYNVRYHTMTAGILEKGENPNFRVDVAPKTSQLIRGENEILIGGDLHRELIEINLLLQRAELKRDRKRLERMGIIPRAVNERENFRMEYLSVTSSECVLSITSNVKGQKERSVCSERTDKLKLRIDNQGRVWASQEDLNDACNLFGKLIGFLSHIPYIPEDRMIRIPKVVHKSSRIQVAVAQEKAKVTVECKSTGAKEAFTVDPHGHLLVPGYQWREIRKSYLESGNQIYRQLVEWERESQKNKKFVISNRNELSHVPLSPDYILILEKEFGVSFVPNSPQEGSVESIRLLIKQQSTEIFLTLTTGGWYMPDDVLDLIQKLDQFKKKILKDALIDMNLEKVKEGGHV